MQPLAVYGVLNATGEFRGCAAKSCELGLTSTRLAARRSLASQTCLQGVFNTPTTPEFRRGK